MGLDQKKLEKFLNEIKGTILETIIEDYTRINPNQFKTIYCKNQEDEIIIDELNDYEKKFYAIFAGFSQQCSLIEFRANQKDEKTDSKFESSLIFNEANRKIKELECIGAIAQSIVLQSVYDRHPYLKNAKIRPDFKITDTDEFEDKIPCPINFQRVVNNASTAVH